MLLLKASFWVYITNIVLKVFIIYFASTVFEWIMAESAIYKEFLLSKQRWHNRKRSNLFSKGCKNSELHFEKIWPWDCGFLLYYCSSPVSVLLCDALSLLRANLWYRLNSTMGMSSHLMRWNSSQTKGRLNQSNLGSLQRVNEGTEAPFAILHLILDCCPREEWWTQSGKFPDGLL